MKIEDIAQTLIWWKDPQDVSFDFDRLVHQVMDQGTWEMIQLFEKHYGRGVFIAALQNAEAGDFSPQSWKYWHLVLGIKPIPPLPQRSQ